MNVLHDVFGRSYQVVTSQDGIVSTKREGMVFYDPMSASRFIRSLNVDQSYWRRYFYIDGVANPNLFRGNDVLDHVSHLLVRGKIKIFQAYIPDKQANPLSLRSLDAGSKQIVFLSAAEAGFKKAKNIKIFHSERDAGKFLENLNLSETKLKAVAKALPPNNSTSLPKGGRKAVVVRALVKGELVIEERVKTGPRPAESQAVEDTHDIPGNRPVEAPPPIDQKPKEKEKQESKDVEQVEALVEAAEIGEAFCENCQNAENENNTTNSTGNSSSAG